MWDVEDFKYFSEEQFLGAPGRVSMELDGSHLGSQGFSGSGLYESVLMHFKDAICLRKIFF